MSLKDVTPWGCDLIKRWNPGTKIKRALFSGRLRKVARDWAEFPPALTHLC